jgi:cyanosortase A-associated protein
LFIPTPKKHSQFQLPKQITLANWRSQPSNEENIKSNAIAAQRYTYTSSTQTSSTPENLRIDLLYIDAAVDVPKHLRMLGLKSVDNYSDQRYLVTSGNYVVFSDQDRAYLASCINPRGGSTVTGQQFMHNRNTYDITPSRIGLYLLGMTDLRDTRCLFTIMSIPLKTKKSDNQSINSLDNIYQKLENTWTDWYQNWGNNFPEN